MAKYAKINVFTKKVETVSHILPSLPEGNFWVEVPEDAVNFESVNRGYTYDTDNLRFIPPKPFSSWTLNETTLEYQAPVSKPTSGTPSYGTKWRWNEESQVWE